MAKRMIDVNLEQWQRMPLEAADNEAVLNRLAGLQLAGGVIFDALIAQSALKVDATAIVTLNAKHFLRLGTDVSALVVEP